MKRIVLNNGLKIIYERSFGSLTSFCIGFEAGANMEQGYSLGIAHALEHMVFKETINRNEKQINEEIDNIFGFSNAMTNFPYSIYYGTCKNNDFEIALEIYQDILLNPILSEEGFHEERKVILQELLEWGEDLDQHCEDNILYNSFNTKRIKNLIIGTEKSLKDMQISEIKRFYNEYYNPENCVISVVSPQDFQEVTALVKKHFESWHRKDDNIVGKNEIIQDSINSGIYMEDKEGFNGAKVKYIFDISGLNEEEIYALHIFNEYFGSGVSSVLYEEIRTLRSMAYEVYSEVKAEKGIGFFSIFISTSKEYYESVLKVVDDIIKNHINDNVNFNIEKSKKRFSLKKALEVERTIVLANRMATYEIMYGNSNRLFKEINGDYYIEEKFIKDVLKKVFNKGAVQVIK